MAAEKSWVLGTLKDQKTGVTKETQAFIGLLLVFLSLRLFHPVT